MEKKKIAFFDAKSYDKIWFDKLGGNYDVTYFEEKLNKHTAKFVEGFDGVCAFVNDDINAAAIERLYKNGVKVIAMRSAGYSNIDVRAAYKKINILRVPAYSPHAVAEHAMALLLSVNRKLCKAYMRTREFNFSIAGLTGVDLYGKTVGVIGTGRIGRTFIEICRGFGMKVIAYDLYPSGDDIDFVSLDELLRRSDVISLHCPLSEQTNHILNTAAFEKMKDGVFIINTSRGSLIDSTALLSALNSGKVRGAGLDVYEEEAEIFYEDYSTEIIKDDVLSLLLSKPNVLITSHQGFLTQEALHNIAEVTIKNLDDYFSGKEMLENEVCYHCDEKKAHENCRKNKKERCF